jgi:hypothetical protein
MIVTLADDYIQIDMRTDPPGTIPDPVIVAIPIFAISEIRDVSDIPTETVTIEPV